MILEILIFSVLSLYVALISYLQFGLSKVKTKKDIEGINDSATDLEGISVVIAIRNEEKNIENLIKDLTLQQYPKDKFEIILVDDQSEDGSYEQAERSLSQSGMKYTILRSIGGKKKAIKMGVEHSKFPIIAFTDGDCSIGNLWLTNIEKYIQTGNYQMISGPVFFTYHKFIEKLMALEFASLIVSGAGAIGLNQPIMVNGANMAIRKEAWLRTQESGEGLHLSSGDDMFVMIGIGKIYGKDKIGFMHDTESAVTTNPPKSFADFYYQRVRWTSKSKSYDDMMIILVAILVLITAIAQLISLFAPQLWFFGIPVYFILFTAIKLFIDMPFVNGFLLKYKKEKLSNYAPILVIFYPFYIVIIAITGTILPFKWKNRPLKK